MPEPTRPLHEIPNNQIFIGKLLAIAEAAKGIALGDQPETEEALQAYERYFETFNPVFMVTLLQVLNSFVTKELKSVIAAPASSPHIH